MNKHKNATKKTLSMAFLSHFEMRVCGPARLERFPGCTSTSPNSRWERLQQPHDPAEIQQVWEMDGRSSSLAFTSPNFFMSSKRSKKSNHFIPLKKKRFQQKCLDLLNCYTGALAPVFTGLPVTFQPLTRSTWIRVFCWGEKPLCAGLKQFMWGKSRFEPLLTGAKPIFSANQLIDVELRSDQSRLWQRHFRF